MKRKEKKADKKKLEGNQCYKKKQYQKALNLYTESIQLTPNNYLLYLNKASCFIQLGNIDSACIMCTKSLGIRQSPKGYFRLATCNILKGELDRAEESLKNAEKCVMDLMDEKTKENMLKVLERENKKLREIRKNYKEGIEKMGTGRSLLNFRQIVQQCYYAMKFHKLLVENLILNDNYDGSLEHVNKIWRNFEDKSELFFLKGKTLYYMGKEDEGKKNLRLCLQLNNLHKESKEIFDRIKEIEKIKDKGNSLFREKKFDEAYEVYDKAMQVDPKNKILNSILSCNKSGCKMKKNDYKQARRDASKAIELNDKYYKAYLRRGTCYMHLEDYDKAVSDFSTALKIQPSKEMEEKLRVAQKFAKKHRRRDYYKILGLEKECSDTAKIRKNYRKLAAKWHPDMHQGEDKVEAEEKFKDIVQAWDILGDPQKKKRYDMGMDDVEGMGGVDMSDLFGSMFGGFGGGRRGGDGPGVHFSFGGNRGGDDPFSSMFGGFGGGGRPGGRGRRQGGGGGQQQQCKQM